MPQRMESEVEVMLGPVALFNGVVAAHWSALTRYCRQLTGDVWEAEDLMQDTLLKAFQAAREKQRPIARSYLYRIANTTWIDKCRKRKQMEALTDDLAARDFQPDRLEVRDAIEYLIRHLPPRQQLAIVLKDALDLPIQEIAERLRTTSGAVKALLHRARETLAHVRDADTTARAQDEPAQTDENLVAACLAALNREDPEAFIHLLTRIQLDAEAGDATPLHLLQRNSVRAEGSSGSTPTRNSLAMAA